MQGSFVPDRQHRELRLLLVHRSRLIREKASTVNRVQKVMENCSLKRSAAVSDIRGTSAQTLMKETPDHGAPSPDRIRTMIAEKTVARHLKAAPEELSAALDGVISAPVRVRFRSLEHTTHCLETEINALTDQIRGMFSPKETAAVRLLQTIPGIGEDSAYTIVGIIGCGMRRFQTSEELCTWPGPAPGSNEGAGKRKSAEQQKGMRR